MAWDRFFLYLAVMAGVTYLIRMLPLALFHRPIRSRYIRSFLYYVPYAVLSAMTFPDILNAAGRWESSLAGLVAAVMLSLWEKSLTVVAVFSCLAALGVHLVLG
jgi:branched-subunit amino acid transport protein